MEVILAGYNLDCELISRLGPAAKVPESTAAGEPPTTDALTPETLSAAYARISRDPRPIPELRRDARRDVARARQSNRRIIFDFGHASVAEHAVFNFDILGLSRLAVEAFEAARLGSYTEKSQRYILLGRDVLLPTEIAGTAHEATFLALMKEQQEAYHSAYDSLARHYAETRPEAWAEPHGRRDLEGAAKEDARYFLALATTGQLGATLNARMVEASIRRLAADPLAEARELAERLHRAVESVAPSLVRHADPTPYRAQTPAALAELRDALCPDGATPGAKVPAGVPGNVHLIAVTPAAEKHLLTGLLHGCGGISWEGAAARAAGLDAHGRRALITESLRRLSAHEAPMRVFELVELTYELIVSASCFAQLKRHRMATLLPQPYEPDLGVTLPPVFDSLGLTKPFTEMRSHAEAIYADIRRVHPHAAPYALTNAHRRRVIFKTNLRELYHIARLRLDQHAQWDVRAMAEAMVAQARARLPLATLLAAGKDAFDETRGRVLGNP
ncbi:MAG: FAD-dependent thymidylate synthase [Candidatus Eisenbacteria sp.]|nr:FAD-dependent thymidylate synthase [Candidatus Eisenbacteria bacterium]